MVFYIIFKNAFRYAGDDFKYLSLPIEASVLMSVLLQPF